MSKVLLPASMYELWALSNEHPDALPMAGGTDLLVKMREMRQEASIIILDRIEELRKIELNDAGINIGAAATHQQLIENPIIAGRLPGLSQAAAVVGSPAIRHMGTIGGNICTASPAGDTLAPLYVLQANVEIASPTGSRTIAIQDFIKGPGKVDLRPQELLKQVRIPLPGALSSSSYFKVGQRKALAISICSMAVFMQFNTDQYIEEARIGWGSVGPTVMCFPEADALLKGQKLSASLLKEYGKLASRQVETISDIRASASYRKMLVANLPLRLLGQPVERSSL